MLGWLLAAACVILILKRWLRHKDEKIAAEAGALSGSDDVALPEPAGLAAQGGMTAAAARTARGPTAELSGSVDDIALPELTGFAVQACDSGGEGGGGGGADEQQAADLGRLSSDGRHELGPN